MVVLEHNRGVLKVRDDFIIGYKMTSHKEKGRDWKSGKRKPEKDKMVFSLELYLDSTTDYTYLKFSSSKKLMKACKILDEIL